MRRISLFVTMAFFAGLGIGYYARSAGVVSADDKHAADLAAIEKLHKADVEATLTQDAKSLNALWSDDAVNLVFPTPAVGLPAIREAFAKFKVDYPEFRVSKYVSTTKEIQIIDGWAMEVMNSDATYQLTAKDAPVSVKAEGMRVLKKQTDGSWKFALVGLK